jgi:hypothetical protein
MVQRKKAGYGLKLQSKKKPIMWSKSMNNTSAARSVVMKDMGSGERGNCLEPLTSTADNQLVCRTG